MFDLPSCLNFCKLIFSERLSPWFLTSTLFTLAFVLKNYMEIPVQDYKILFRVSTMVQYILFEGSLPSLPWSNSHYFEISSFNSGTIWELLGFHRKMLCCRSLYSLGSPQHVNSHILCGFINLNPFVLFTLFWNEVWALVPGNNT